MRALLANAALIGLFCNGCGGAHRPAATEQPEPAIAAEAKPSSEDGTSTSEQQWRSCTEANQCTRVYASCMEIEPLDVNKDSRDAAQAYLHEQCLDTGGQQVLGVLQEPLEHRCEQSMCVAYPS